MKVKKVVNRSSDEVFDLWMKALRSGEYKQTEGRLRRDNSFCYLGVLYDLAVKDGGTPWGSFWHKPEGAFISESNGLPPPEITSFMFGDEHWVIANFIAEANDSGLNFQQMANLISSIKSDVDEGLDFDSTKYGV